MTIKEKLENIGQGQLLKFESDLTEEQKKNLYEQIDGIDFEVTKLIDHRGNPEKKGEITPLAALDLDAIEKNRSRYYEAGVDAIKAGKVGAVLLAGDGW